MNIDLRLGDCLELMKDIADKSMDAIICDLPYGTTQCKWDSIIPFEPLWKQYKRIIKDNGAIVLFGSQPFTSALIMSNSKMFKYEWIWQKNKATGHLNAKIMPMKEHENIIIFGKGKVNYTPQMTEGHKRYCSTGSNVGNKSTTYGKETDDKIYRASNKRYPKTILPISYEFGRKVGEKTGRVHPTQKPLELMEYLIKTYSNENETILDNTMGSGTTMLACKNLNRNGIGIEMDEDYFNIAKKRVEEKKEEKDNEPPTLFNAQN